MAQSGSCCVPATVRRALPPAHALPSPDCGTRSGVVWLPGGNSHVGTRAPLIGADGERFRKVSLKPFGIERTAVTNARFARFVERTGYATEAERYGWSFVFKDALDPQQRQRTPRAVEAPWWHRMDGAFWRRPSGPDGPECIPDHPVVHVSWNDATAFATWHGGRLLSEAEWEFAARGGRDVVYPWGDEDPPDTAPLCNNWQGDFPDSNLATDGYEGTAPVDAFAANGYGLKNMAGNVWEWCADAFRVRSLSSAGRERDRAARGAGERLLKGGSYLCHRSYCHRYRIAARMGRSPDTTAGHIGFRIGYDSRQALPFPTGIAVAGSRSSS